MKRDEAFTMPYGRGQWVSLRADGMLNWKQVAQLVDRSYRTVATKRLIDLLHPP